MAICYGSPGRLTQGLWLWAPRWIDFAADGALGMKGTLYLGHCQDGEGCWQLERTATLPYGVQSGPISKETAVQPQGRPVTVTLTDTK